MNRRSRTTVALLGLPSALALFLFAVRSADVAEARTALAPPASSASEAIERAERHAAEGSYQLAREILLELDRKDLDADAGRWIDFRLADTLWRSVAATDTPDATELDGAREALEALAAGVRRAADRDRVWAEVQESLGDWWWARRESRNWGQGWSHYQLALEWWGGSRDLDLARKRYLEIVWKAAEPPQPEPFYSYGYHGNQLPEDVLRNVLRITDDPAQRSRAWFMIAMGLRWQGGPEGHLRRVSEAFEAALEPAGTAWYDDALYHYAEWLTQSGRIVRLDGGGFAQEPDFVRALELFRRLTREFVRGQTRYHDDALRQIEAIAAPQVGVAVPEFFLPGSAVRYQVTWRNVPSVDLALYSADLTRDLDWRNDDRGGDWLESIRLAGSRPVRAWTWQTNDRGDHRSGHETLDLGSELAPGAYVLEARAGERKARDLLLVSGASVVLETSGRRGIVYVCDATTGAPRAGAAISFWTRTDDDRGRWQQSTARTGSDGLASFDLPGADRHVEVFAAARHGDDQAFALSARWIAGRAHESWKLYVFTDRPAYRPGERSKWKVVARTHDGSTYATPVGREIGYEIVDPRGAKVADGALTLNRFGSAWGELDLAAEQPLGEYQVRFVELPGRRSIGSAALLRLEEYKLPEFRVDVRMPEESGRPRALRAEDPVEAEIVARYYFGGPVAGAAVEVLVHQRPLWVQWVPPREFPWYHDAMPAERGWRPPEQTVHRETLTTDAEGRATLRFEPAYDASQDREYVVEARVTDASRREVVGRGSVRASRQRYFAFVHAEHNLHRPGDTARVMVKTVDAGERPFAAEGRVRVTRDRWIETWIDPDGRRVSGEQLERARKRERGSAPPPATLGAAGAAHAPGWRLAFRGYEHEEVVSRRVTTGAGGEAEVTFVPADAGYYRVTWSGDEEQAFPVSAEATVWVADPDSAQIGYHSGGVEILVDADTLHAGGTTPVMLSAPLPDSWVLFTVQAEEILDVRVVHLTGTVKLLELEIDQRHVPNAFLDAVLVRDGELSFASREIVVPPVAHFLEVEVTADREEYRPREAGVLTVTTRDHAGNPVAAEVALGLIDESVLAIQQEYAGDPRPFFFGTKRQKGVETQSSFHVRPFARLVRDAEGGWRDRLRADEGDTAGAGLEDSMELGGLHGARGRAAPSSMRMEAAMAKSSAAPMEMAEDERISADAPPPAAIAPGQEPAVEVRSDFRATALWRPDVVTGADGTARVDVSFPDSLTTWRATARAATTGSAFGHARSSTRTKKPLIVRLQAPRFFVVGDRAVVSAIVNNDTEAALDVSVSLDVRGLEIAGVGSKGAAGDDGQVLLAAGREQRARVGVGGAQLAHVAGRAHVEGRGEQLAHVAGRAHVEGRGERHLGAAGGERRVRVAAGGEQRVEWEVAARDAGEARLTATARGAGLDDAMALSYPVHEHGVEKLVARSGKARGDEVRVSIDLPAARRAGSTAMTVQVTPSLAVTMLDALPYLIDYPYGCTEQTVSRFLPAAITARTLESLGLDPERIAGRIFGGVEPEHAAATHPAAAAGIERLDGVVRAGLRRLADFQHADGGWGWWKEGESDPLMSAYVVWGTSLARDAGLRVDASVLRRGVEFLERELIEAEEQPDLQAWMLHAVSAEAAGAGRRPSDFQRAALDNLWARRDRLNAYSRALLALSAHQLGDGERARTLARNLANGVRRDRAPDASVVVSGSGGGAPEVLGTAHWGADGIWWRWSDGPVESTAFALRALLAIDPDSELIEPVTHWLVRNRRGAQWSNTRDTAIALLALGESLRQSGELGSTLEFAVEVNGRGVAARRIDPDGVLGAPSRFAIDPSWLRAGPNEVRILRRAGDGALYFAVEARYFSLEEPVTPAGNEIFAQRSYDRLAVRPTLLRGPVAEREPLGDDGRLASGDRVEVRVVIEAKNDYEYLVLEDLKPAGLEAVALVSGEPLAARELTAAAAGRRQAEPDSRDYTGRARPVYQELRDRKVALFLDKLPQGVWEIRYVLRAETPGTFHALPLLGHVMYVPEIRCNSAELRLDVAGS